VTISAAHEDGKGDYSAEVGALAQAGGEVLVVAGYLDQGGKGIIQAALDTGAFDTFYLPDGMAGDSLVEAIGSRPERVFGANPGHRQPGRIHLHADMAKAAGFERELPFLAESYDAAALILLAMQAAGSTDSAKLKDKVMEVANAPGEKIYPGELAKALKILKDGGDIDYVGASAVSSIGPGESAGNYREFVIKDGKIETVVR
jgi:branched-chain amino acid transport system substrate-binding protein